MGGSSVREHELKTWPQYFERIISGEKTFEVRKDDRGYQAGDVLVLREFDPTPRCPAYKSCYDQGCDHQYTGRTLRFTVGFIYRHAPGWLDCGEYVVMSLVSIEARGADKPKVVNPVASDGDAA